MAVPGCAPQRPFPSRWFGLTVGVKTSISLIAETAEDKSMRPLLTIICVCLLPLPGFSQATLSLAGRVPDVHLTGTPGLNYRLDYINVYGPTNAWVALTNLTLTNSLQHYYDVSALGKPPRLYRLVQLP
jgi:hypothetical protein